MPRGNSATVDETPDATVDPQALFIASAIENTKGLLEAKRSIQSEIQAARDFLNQAVRMGAVTNDQQKWIDENLPKRKRKPKGEDGDGDSSPDTADATPDPVPA